MDESETSWTEASDWGSNGEYQPLESGLEYKPPFLPESSNSILISSGFIDQGNLQLSKKSFYTCCEAYFLWRHNLGYSPDGGYDENIREKMLQHIASPEFIAARTLFLSAIKQKDLPEVTFLLWELYGHKPTCFIEQLRILRALRSASSSVLHDLEILAKNAIFPGLREFLVYIEREIKSLEADPKTGSMDMGLQFLKALSVEMRHLRDDHMRYSQRNLLDTKDWLDKFWDEDARDHWIFGPYEYGLNYFLYRELQRIDESPRFMLRTPNEQLSSTLSTVSEEKIASNDLEGEESARDPNMRLLFGIAGCGKTKKIFDILSSCWGLYILPGGRSESLAKRNLQNDSVLLWYTISQVMKSLHKICEEEEMRAMVDRLVNAFLASRFREFKRMYQTTYSSTTSKDVCTHWLQYQLTASCVEDNHFERYFAIARYLPESRIDFTFEDKPEYPEIFPNWLPGGKFYFCFDEFQSDFDPQAASDSVPDGHEYSPAYHGLMHNILGATTDIIENIKRRTQWRTYLTGTSSYLVEVTRAIKRGRPTQPQSKSFYEIQSKFDRIENFRDEFPEFLLTHTNDVLREAWAIFKATYESRMATSGRRGTYPRYIRDADGDMDYSDWDCLQSSGFLKTSGRHIPDELRSALLGLFCGNESMSAEAVEEKFADLQQTIQKNQELITEIGYPLRGRYLWSSTYSQLVLATMIQCYLRRDNEDPRKSFEEHVTKFEQKTITGLISNLIKLRETNMPIYSNICRLTIRADALNKPTLFPDDYTGEMVTRGFAYAHSDPNTFHWKEGYVKIGEPLAVRAVLQYLESDTEGKIEFARQISEMVYMNQDNASGLGFSTEYYLASNFDAVFRKGVEFISTDRRVKVLSHLQTSLNPIYAGVPDTRWISSCNALQLCDFELLQPTIDDGDLGKRLPFENWLEQLYEATQTTPKFCFPSTVAGPDLAFILNRTQNKGHHPIDRILVTVQSKTAEQKTSEGFKISETIHTVDPNLWYISSKTRRPATKSIVEKWGADTSCLILSLLVVTSDFIMAGADEICKKYRTDQYRMQRCKEQHQTKPGPSNKQGTDGTLSLMAKELYRNLPNVNYAFCGIDRDMTQNLFGDTFTKLIDMTKKRPVKRPAPKDGNQPDAMGRPKAKRLKINQPNPRRCSACGEVDHMKNNPICRLYKGKAVASQQSSK